MVGTGSCSKVSTSGYSSCSQDSIGGCSSCGRDFTGGYGIVGVGVCVLGGVVADLGGIATIAIGCPNKLS